MKLRVIPAASLAAFALVCGNARASAIGNVSVSNIQFQLIDLRPDDGIAPSLTLQSDEGFVSVYSYGPYGSFGGLDDHKTNGATGFGAVSLSRYYYYGTSASSVSGSMSTQNLKLFAGAEDEGDGVATIESRSWIAPTFTLSPETMLIITATAHLDANATPNTGQEGVFSNAGITVSSTPGSSDGSFSYDGVQLYVDNFNSGPVSLSQDSPLALSYINDGTSNRKGYLKVSASVFDYFTGESVSAVPEEGTAGLMLAGLCGVGLLARRRKSPAAASGIGKI